MSSTTQDGGASTAPEPMSNQPSVSEASVTPQPVAQQPGDQPTASPQPNVSPQLAAQQSTIQPPASTQPASTQPAPQSPAAHPSRPNASGMLSMVGTPIGNLQDASPRVLDTLASANVILCEDTRVTSKLLARFGISVSLRRCDQNVIASRVDEVMNKVASGERVAFVSDAGMPGVSDPGQHLVDAALDAGLPVEVIPGPSAVTCALVASGLPMDHFFFEGFLPRKAGAREQRLTELAAIPGALVFYESPHRVVATLQSVAKVMPLRRAALVRELTKLHEETVRDLAPQLAQRIAERQELRGECVIVVEGPVPGETASSQGPALSLDDAIQAGLDAGESKSRLAKRLAREYHLSRSEVYDLLLNHA